MPDFHVVTKGDPKKPAVLCVHGLLGSSRNVLRLQEAIADAGFYAIAYDQRGHGRSKHAENPEQYSLEKLAADAFEVLDLFSIKSAHFLGHSLGARVCLTATSQRPERILSLTMLDAGITVGEGGKGEVRKIIASLPASFESRADADQKLSIHSLGIKQFLISNLRDRDGVFTWLFDLEGIRSHLVRRLDIEQVDIWKNVRCPILLLRGDRSTYLTQEEQDAMILQNPNAKKVVVSNSGHWVHVDNFVDTSTAVTQFLQSVRK